MSYTFEIFKSNFMLLLSNLGRVFVVLAGCITFALSSYIIMACLHSLYNGTMGELGIPVLVASICMLTSSVYSIRGMERQTRCTNETYRIE